MRTGIRGDTKCGSKSLAPGGAPLRLQDGYMVRHGMCIRASLDGYGGYRRARPCKSGRSGTPRLHPLTIQIRSEDGALAQCLSWKAPCTTHHGIAPIKPQKEKSCKAGLQSLAGWGSLSPSEPRSAH